MNLSKLYPKLDEKLGVNSDGGVWYIFIGAWLVFRILSIISALLTIASMEESAEQGHVNKLNSSFLTEFKIGYFVLLAIAIIVFIAFFKKSDKYIYLEIGNVIARLSLILFIIIKEGNFNVLEGDFSASILKMAFVSTLLTIFLFKSKGAKETFVN